MLLHPPALQAPAPRLSKPVSLTQAEDLVLQAYDEGQPIPSPGVAAAERAALTWLRANALPAAGKKGGPGPLPVNPFKPGTLRYQEARAWLAFMKAPEGEWDAQLKQLSLGLTGTQLGLWRWGQAMALHGKLSPGTRRAFEDRLAASPVAGLRGYALRHALCYAVAEKDEARFASLRERYSFVEADLFRPFQRLLSLLGGAAPPFRLYSLPGLEYRDGSLAGLGGSRIWMMPADARLEPLPADVDWIIPSALGNQDPKEAVLDLSTSREGDALSKRLAAAGRRAWFAASRSPFEAYGLVHFPILIELDTQQRIRSIRMGDAAPERP